MNSKEENAFVSGLLAKGETAWIGGFKNALTNGLQWVENTLGERSVAYTNFAENEPNMSGNCLAVTIDADGEAMWSDADCSAVQNFICEMQAPDVGRCTMDVVEGGAVCNPILPAAYATDCASGFTCISEEPLIAGFCTPRETIVVGAGDACTMSTDAPYDFVCPFGYRCVVPSNSLYSTYGNCIPVDAAIVGPNEICNPNGAPGYQTVCQPEYSCLFDDLGVGRCTPLCTEGFNLVFQSDGFNGTRFSTISTMSLPESFDVPHGVTYTSDELEIARQRCLCTCNTLPACLGSYFGIDTRRFLCRLLSDLGGEISTRFISESWKKKAKL